MEKQEKKQTREEFLINEVQSHLLELALSFNDKRNKEAMGNARFEVNKVNFDWEYGK